MTDGLDVVLDGTGEVTLGVEVISVLPEDVHQAVRVVVLRFGDSDQERKLMLGITQSNIQTKSFKISLIS